MRSWAWLGLIAACGQSAETVDGRPAADGDASPSPWRYVASAGAVCANGTPTGFGLSLAPDARELLLVIQGGGACWEGLACYGLGTASHFQETVDEPIVLAEVGAPALAGLFDRDLSDNRFADAAMAYVPYCTGDLHGGTAVHTYDYFGPQVAHHVGALNMQAHLDTLLPSLPATLERVTVIGLSAGGYGATLNADRLRAAFGPTVRVDIIADSSPMIDVAPDGRWGTMRAAWTLELPTGCPACANGFSAWLPYHAATVPAPHRYGLLAFTGDDVIGTFFGLDDATQAAAVTTLQTAMGAQQRLFLQAGNAHVMLALNPWPTSGSGVALSRWIDQVRSDDTTWAHQAP